jgi:TRAP transporter TAXI family solute receptor
MPAMPAERLDSWKEIAAYLKRDVATVRRWEKREALPVHRHLHQKLGSVYAYTSELDAWLEGRRQQIEQLPLRTGRWPTLWIAIVAGLLATIAGTAYVFRDSVRGDSARPRVRLAVHRPGTVASLIVAGLQDVLRRTMPDVEVELVEQPGMISTLRAIDSGSVDLGLAFNLLAFHAVKTDQVLNHRSGKITALTVAYATPAQIVVHRDSDLRTIADLKGKRVSLGIAESGERFCSRILLSHLGFGVKDLVDRSIDFAPSLEDLRARRLDAYITWRGMPVPDLAQAFASGEFRLLPLDVESLQGLRLKHPFLVPWTIPARVYAHQDAPVPTVSARILLLASKSLSADLLEQIMRAIGTHMPDLVARHPAAAAINVKQRPTLDDGLSIDLHPGAERFFESAAAR